MSPTLLSPIRYFVVYKAQDFFGEHSVEYLAMDISSKKLLYVLPELVLERIGQLCDVDTL